MSKLRDGLYKCYIYLHDLQFSCSVNEHNDICPAEFMR